MLYTCRVCAQGMGISRNIYRGAASHRRQRENKGQRAGIFEEENGSLGTSTLANRRSPWNKQRRNARNAWLFTPASGSITSSTTKAFDLFIWLDDEKPSDTVAAAGAKSIDLRPTFLFIAFNLCIFDPLSLITLTLLLEAHSVDYAHSFSCLVVSNLSCLKNAVVGGISTCLQFSSNPG